MIEVLSSSLARQIKRTVPAHPASENVLKFAISAILNGVFIVSFSLLISLVLHTTVNALIVLVAFAVLRQMSGGIHLKSGTACILVSTTGVTILSLIEVGTTAILVLNCCNMLLTAAFAPSGIEKQTRIKPKYFPILKISSTILVGTNFFIGSSVLAVTFFVQCLTLIKTPAMGRG